MLNDNSDFKKIHVVDSTLLYIFKNIQNNAVHYLWTYIFIVNVQSQAAAY